MEDRIVGPLTLVQFVYVMFGGMIVYIAYDRLYFTNPIIFFAIAVPVGIIALSLAFLKVNEEPLPNFFVASLLFLTRPKQRVWLKSGSSPTEVVHKIPTTPEEPPGAHRLINKGQLEDISKTLDQS